MKKSIKGMFVILMVLTVGGCSQSNKNEINNPTDNYPKGLSEKAVFQNSFDLTEKIKLSNKNPNLTDHSLPIPRYGYSTEEIASNSMTGDQILYTENILTDNEKYLMSSNNFIGDFNYFNANGSYVLKAKDDVLLFKDINGIPLNNFHMIVSPNTNTPTNIIFLGDSTVEAGYIMKKMNQENSNLRFYGSRTTFGIQHEGRGGWSANRYRTEAVVNGVTNQFYNPVKKDFDFSYYRKNTGKYYPSIDIVFIQLGINDMFLNTDVNNTSSIVDSVIEDMKYIADDIKSCSPKTNVVFNLPIPPTNSEEEFDKYYKGVQKLSVYEYNNRELVKAMISKLNSYNLIPINLIIDRSTMTNVHPNEDGYTQIAKMCYGYVNRWRALNPVKK